MTKHTSGVSTRRDLAFFNRHKINRRGLVVINASFRVFDRSRFAALYGTVKKTVEWDTTNSASYLFRRSHAYGIFISSKRQGYGSTYLLDDARGAERLAIEAVFLRQPLDRGILSKLVSRQRPRVCRGLQGGIRVPGRVS